MSFKYCERRRKRARTLRRVPFGKKYSIFCGIMLLKFCKGVWRAVMWNFFIIKRAVVSGHRTVHTCNNWRKVLDINETRATVFVYPRYMIIKKFETNELIFFVKVRDYLRDEH